MYFFQNELAVSEFIQNIVETLNSYFKKVVSVFNADYYKFQLRNVCINFFLIFVSFRLRHMYPCRKEPQPVDNLKIKKGTKRHFAIQNINKIRQAVETVNFRLYFEVIIRQNET